jgi:signal transduction histidine kinase
LFDIHAAARTCAKRQLRPRNRGRREVCEFAHRCTVSHTAERSPPRIESFARSSDSSAIPPLVAARIPQENTRTLVSAGARPGKGCLERAILSFKGTTHAVVTALVSGPRMITGEPARLLIVEDDIDTQANLRDILELDGYQIETVSTLGQARQKEWHDVFAFVLDHRLPDGTAEELLPEIRDAAPSAGILIVTGYADLGGTITALRHGVDDYILKPIDADALRASLIRIRKLRDARDRLIQSERLAAIGQMVSGIAHESRNFLQKISAAVESLESKSGWDAEDQADLAGIRRGCDGLTRLLDDLRQYAGPLKLDRCRWDLSNVWRAAWKSLAHECADKKAELDEPVKCRDFWASIDHFRMEQVFRNLFENALAACATPARIIVQCEKSPDCGMLKITIADNGPGLKAAQPATVFEPFFTTKTRGTGLGLSIVRRIVEAHGGTVSARNGPQGGAVFELELPTNGASENGASDI